MFLLGILYFVVYWYVRRDVPECNLTFYFTIPVTIFAVTTAAGIGKAVFNQWKRLS